MKNSLSLGLILSGLLLLNVVAFAQDPDLTAEEVLKNTVAASSNMHGCDSTLRQGEPGLFPSLFAGRKTLADRYMR